MSGGGFAIIIWIAVFFGIFYFLAVRPQRRQRQQHTEMVAMLKKGDEIVTVGGMFGVVRRLGDDWIELEITKGTRVRFLKRAISQIVSEEEEEDEYEEYADEIDDADEVDAVDEARGRGSSRSTSRPPTNRRRRSGPPSPSAEAGTEKPA